MARVRVVINRDGIRSLLKEPGVASDIARRAALVAAAAGGGHDVQSMIGRVRVRSTVMTTSFAAMREEATNRSLSRAVDAARR